MKRFIQILVGIVVLGVGVLSFLLLRETNKAEAEENAKRTLAARLARHKKPDAEAEAEADLKEVETLTEQTNEQAETTKNS